MKIAIVTDIHVGKPLEHQGNIRASSDRIEKVLPQAIKRLCALHSPDLVIQLGDLIRSESKESDLSRYSCLLTHFDELGIPVIHLLGNHELKKMSREEVERAWHTGGLEQKSFGSREVGAYTVIWLGLDIDLQNPVPHTLPTEQVEWLKNELARTARPTLIFSHCPIDDQSVEGNFFYEAMDDKRRNLFFLNNQNSIRKIISSSKSVVAVFQGHLHYFHAKKVDGISFITCPAFGDNICGPNVAYNIPEIYTLITLESNKMVVKALSGNYCFAGYSY